MGDDILAQQQVRIGFQKRRRPDEGKRLIVGGPRPGDLDPALHDPPSEPQR